MLVFAKLASVTVLAFSTLAAAAASFNRDSASYHNPHPEYRSPQIHLKRAPEIPSISSLLTSLIANVEPLLAQLSAYTALACYFAPHV